MSFEVGPDIGGATSALGWSYGPQKKSPGKKAPLLRPRWCDRANDRWKVECVEAETPLWAAVDPPDAWLEATVRATPRHIRKAAYILYIMARPLIRNIRTHTRPGLSRAPRHN